MSGLLPEPEEPVPRDGDCGIISKPFYRRRHLAGRTRAPCRLRKGKKPDGPLLIDNRNLILFPMHSVCFDGTLKCNPKLMPSQNPGGMPHPCFLMYISLRS